MIIIIITIAITIKQPGKQLVVSFSETWRISFEGF